MPKPTIVLVHGAWADGSSWNAVSAELRGQGFTVFAPPSRRQTGCPGWYRGEPNLMEAHEQCRPGNQNHPVIRR